MNSITCTDLKDPSANAGLIAHLRHDDFFAVDEFPTAQFVLKSAETLSGNTEGSPTHHLRGDFTLRGITAPIEFDANLDLRPEGGWGAQALFAIDRTRWNVCYGSGRLFARLGQHLVSDHIHLHLKILTKASAT
jgi:polyisoprenoid-binding protein YceI